MPIGGEFLTALGGGLFFLVTVRAQGVDVPVRVQIGEDGIHRAFTGKMDMGQGSRTLLTQAFAEELGVPVDRVQLVMGDTLLCPDDGGVVKSDVAADGARDRQAAAAVCGPRFRRGWTLRVPRTGARSGRRFPTSTAGRLSRAQRRIRPTSLHLACCTPPSYEVRTIARV